MRLAAIREDIQGNILEAAERLFQRYGYRKTTVEDIADDAGLSRGTVYLHYRGKEEIALAWADRMSARRRQALREIARGTGPPGERLREMMAARVLFSFDCVRNHAQGLNDLFAALRPALLERRERNHAEEAAVFAEIVAEGCECGVFACEDPLTTARLLVVITNALLPYSLSARQLGERDEIEAKIHGIAGMLLDGLRRRDGSAECER